MDRMLTVSQMNRRFPAEWLLVTEPKTNRSQSVTSGHVVFHSKDRDEVYREAVRLRPKAFATVYTGTIAKDAAVVL